MITDVFINDFSVVNPGSKVMRIVQTGNYEIAVSIPVSHIDEVKVGTKSHILTTEGKEKGSGTVVRVSDVINRNTQSIEVYVKPEAFEGERFIEGEYVQVLVNTTGEFGGVRIPANSIVDNQVYVYSTKDSTLALHPVVIMDENEKGTFVTGLEDNSIVITQDVLNFTDTTKYAVLIK